MNIRYEEELDDVERCRRVRRAIEARFRDLHAYCEYLRRLDPRGRRGHAVAGCRKSKVVGSGVSAAGGTTVRKPR